MEPARLPARPQESLLPIPVGPSRPSPARGWIMEAAPRSTPRPARVATPRAAPDAENVRTSANPALCGSVEGGCEIADLFKLLGKAHMLDLLYIFLRETQGPRRFVDIQERLRISPNTLSERLKELVEAGLLTRTAYNEIPPRVDYEATAKAHDLHEVFSALFAWTRRHNLKPVEPSSQASA